MAEPEKGLDFTVCVDRVAAICTVGCCRSMPLPVPARVA